MTTGGDLPLASRLMWVTGLRLLVTSVFFGLFVFFYLDGNLSSHTTTSRWLVTIISTTFGLGLAYASVLRTQRFLVPLANLQIVADQVVATALVYVSGGVSSGATSLYALTCLTGAILVGRRGAILAASVGLGLYALLSAGFATGRVAPPPDQPLVAYARDLTSIIFPFLLSSFAIVIVSGLSGYLAERIRETGGALEEAERRADRAERLAELGRISAWLAHEIRNPLGSIQGSVELLGEAAALSDDERKLLSIVRRESRRLEALVRDMLDLARANDPEPRVFDLARVVEETAALARADVTTNHVTITTEGLREGAFVRADESQVRQVVWNLLRNAVHASPEGTSVTLRIEEANGHRELAVVDSGTGIDPADRPRLFDAFFTKKRSQGTGIGLSVVKRIIDDHAGLGVSISVDESPADAAHGAIFRVRFPIVTKNG